MIDEKIKAEAHANYPHTPYPEKGTEGTFRNIDEQNRLNERSRKGFIAGANFGKEMRWVKVSEGLPSNDREVLLYSEKKGFQLGAYEGDGRWFSNGWIAYPTHWMPLPPEPGRGE